MGQGTCSLCYPSRVDRTVDRRLETEGLTGLNQPSKPVRRTPHGDSSRLKPLRIMIRPCAPNRISPCLYNTHYRRCQTTRHRLCLSFITTVDGSRKISHLASVSCILQYLSRQSLYSTPKFTDACPCRQSRCWSSHSSLCCCSFPA